MTGHKQPPEHAKFPKGKSGNPGGRPKVSAELAHVQQVREVDAKRIFSKYLMMVRPDLQAALASDSLPGFDLIVVSTILSAIAKGDFLKILPIIERLCGKVPVSNTEIALPEPVTIKRINGEEYILASKRSSVEAES
jgi:hypothetical protein